MPTQNQIRFYRKLGAKLLQARIESGLEQMQVAEKLGKTQSYISKIESGDLKVDIFTLNEISKIYKKPIEYFHSN